jgi:hypothetical protein
VFIRRINDTVEMYFDAITPPATWVASSFFAGSISGFGMDKPSSASSTKQIDVWTTLSSSATKMLFSASAPISALNCTLTPESGTPDNTWGSFDGQISWTTSSAWPASLPGSAA